MLIYFLLVFLLCLRQKISDGTVFFPLKHSFHDLKNKIIGFLLMKEEFLFSLLMFLILFEWIFRMG